MKLLQKTSLTYLWFSAIILLLAGAILFFLITSLIEEETTEKMYANVQHIERQISSGEIVRDIPPLISVDLLNKQVSDSIRIKDTLMFDPVEGEKELFREIISITTMEGKTYRIIYRQVIVENHDYLGSIGLSLIIVFLLLLTGLYFLNRKVSGKIWKPFYHNLQILEDFSIDQKYSINLSGSDIEEFRELNKSIYQLTDKVRKDYLVQKEFVANSAHEMQTPLTIIQADLEQALQDQNLSASQAAHIRSSLLAVKRLSKLNKSLLLLMKIENRQYEKLQLLDIEHQISALINNYQDFITSKNLSLNFLPENKLYIRANEVLLDSFLSNLLGNSIKHNHNSGSIDIVIKDETLLITNTGKKPKQSTTKFFDRFVKEDPSATSAGLGLSIVKSICDHYGWSIRYRYENNLHVMMISF